MRVRSHTASCTPTVHPCLKNQTMLQLNCVELSQALKVCGPLLPPYMSAMADTPALRGRDRSLGITQCTGTRFVHTLDPAGRDLVIRHPVEQLWPVVLDRVHALPDRPHRHGGNRRRPSDGFYDCHNYGVGLASWNSQRHPIFRLIVATPTENVPLSVSKTAQHRRLPSFKSTSDPRLTDQDAVGQRP